MIRAGEVAWSRGYGRADARTRVIATEATLFQAASISKPVTAFVVLRLVADGTLELDRDVNAYLRSWRLPDNEHTAACPVTIRHLLTHTAGTTVHGFPGYPAGAPIPTREQILDGRPPANTDPVRVDIPVGSATRYSGGGTTIVEQVLEDVTRTPFPRLAEEVVLSPLGMSSSHFLQPLPASLHGSAASAHEDGQPIAGRWHVYPEQAAAGLWTTSRDLAVFAVGVQRALMSDPGAIVPADIAKLMITPHGPDGFGLGFMPEQSGWAWFGHSGGNRGFACRLIANAHGDGAVVMTNTVRGSAPFISEVIAAVALAHGWEGYLLPEIDVFPQQPGSLDSFVGEWEVDGAGTVTIGTDRGQLILAATRTTMEEELLPLSDTALIGATSGWRWDFRMDPNGHCEEAVVQAGRTRYAVRRKQVTITP